MSFAISSKTPPAIVVGGLSMVRALGMSGVTCVAGVMDEENEVAASRYCIDTFLLPDLKSEDAYIGKLIDIGETLSAKYQSRCPLFYGTDDELLLMYKYRDSLSRYFKFLLSEDSIGRVLMDKTEFARLATEKELTVPRTFDLNRTEDLENLNKSGSCIVKPALGERWDKFPDFRKLFGSGKARVFDSGSELLENELVRSLQTQLIIQEYVPGNDACIVSYHGVADENSQILAWFVGKKIRTFPLATGESSFLELMPPKKSAELKSIGLDTVRKLGLIGPFKMDFKRNPRTGVHYLLEINCRFNLWHYLGAANGVNLPKVAYDYLTSGHASVSDGYSTRYRWINFRRDREAFGEAQSLGLMTFRQWLWSIMNGRLICRLFSLRDPAPFLSQYFGFLRRQSGRWLGTL